MSWKTKWGEHTETYSTAQSTRGQQKLHPPWHWYPWGETIPLKRENNGTVYCCNCSKNNFHWQTWYPFMYNTDFTTGFCRSSSNVNTPCLDIKGALYGIELSTRNSKIWPTRERQHRQYLKISCFWCWRCCAAERWTKLRQLTRQASPRDNYCCYF